MIPDNQTIEQGYTYNPAAADRVARFCSKFLRLSKGQWAGQPLVLTDWQAGFVESLYGWQNASGIRRFRRAYVEIPKKNKKSCTCAALALYHLIADGEQGAEVYIAASDREQAGIIYRECAAMVRANPVLSQHCVCVDSKKTIQFPKTGSTLRALSADAYRQEGINASAVIFDELHAQPNRQLWDTLAYAGAARRQPLTIAITTAGYDRQSICYEQHEYACKVRDGLLDDPTFLPVIYAADKDDDWTQEATWYKANPALGSVITLDAFRSDCLEAQQSPAKQNAFLRYRLNIWTTSDTRWLDMDKWQECGEAFDTSILEGKRCWAGLDLSSTTDITSLALLFRIEGTYYVLSYNWVPDDTAYTRERKGEAPYDTWAKQGYLHTTSGNVIDYEFIRKTVNELAEVYNISEVAIDRWNASHLITLLQGDGLNVVPYGQGYGSMNAPAKELETLILSGKLRHNGNPVLTWFASNCTVETNAAGDIKPSKAKSTERIDGIVALTMALGRAIVDNSPEVPEETQYVQFI